MTKNTKKWLTGVLTFVFLLVGLSLIFFTDHPSLLIGASTDPAPDLGVTHLGSLDLSDNRTSDPTLKINQQGTANLIQVQDSGSDIFTIVNGGGTTFTGPTTHTNNLIVSGDTIAISQTIAVAASFTITPTTSYVVLTSTTAVTSSTSTPIATSGIVGGQSLTIQNGNASTRITLDGTGGTVECGGDMFIDGGEAIMLIFDSSNWICTSKPSFTPEYGEILTTHSTTTQAMVADVPITITLFMTNGESRLAMVDHTADVITVTNAGVYLISTTSSISSSVNNTLFDFHIAVNSIETEISWHRKIGSAGDQGNGSTSGLKRLEAGDVVSLQAEADKSNDMSFITGVLFLEKISR